MCLFCGPDIWLEGHQTRRAHLVLASGSPQTQSLVDPSLSSSFLRGAGDKAHSTRPLLAGSREPGGLGWEKRSLVQTVDRGWGKVEVGAALATRVLRPPTPPATCPSGHLSLQCTCPFGHLSVPGPQCSLLQGWDLDVSPQGISCPSVPWPEPGSPWLQAQGGLCVEKGKRNQACESPGLHAVSWGTLGEAGPGLSPTH